eukprot:1075061-Pleurochrysis_carterae.AAC.7
MEKSECVPETNGQRAASDQCTNLRLTPPADSLVCVANAVCSRASAREMLSYARACRGHQNYLRRPSLLSLSIALSLCLSYTGAASADSARTTQPNPVSVAGRGVRCGPGQRGLASFAGFSSAAPKLRHCISNVACRIVIFSFPVVWLQKPAYVVGRDTT